MVRKWWIRVCNSAMPALGFVHTGSFFCERISTRPPGVFFRAIDKAFGLDMASLLFGEELKILPRCRMNTGFALCSTCLSLLAWQSS